MEQSGAGLAHMIFLKLRDGSLPEQVVAVLQLAPGPEPVVYGLQHLLRLVSSLFIGRFVDSYYHPVGTHC